MVWIQPCKRCTPGLAGFFSKEPESKCLKLWELNSRRFKCSILSLCREDSHGLCKWFESRFRTEPGRGRDWAWAIAGDRSMGGQGTPQEYGRGVEHSRASSTEEQYGSAGSASWPSWAAVTCSHGDISSEVCAFRAEALRLHRDGTQGGKRQGERCLGVRKGQGFVKGMPLPDLDPRVLWPLGL